jgi:putative hydrolase
MRILCDVHTHTIHSRHAYSTLGENVAAAAEAGLELLGTTDHFSPMISATSTFTSVANLRDYQGFLNQDVLPRSWRGVALVRGVEADIVDLDGHLFGHGIPQPYNISGSPYAEPLDLDERVLSDMDYAIASVHWKGFAEGATSAQNTRMYLKVLDNPKVLILGHIGRSGLDFDVDAVVEGARDRGKLIEINETSLTSRAERAGRCRLIAERCAELGCPISLGTDAHVATQVGVFDATLALLDEIGFPEELVASRSAASFLAAIKGAGIAPAARAPLDLG